MLNGIIKYGCGLLLACFVTAGCNKLENMNIDPTKPVNTEPAYLLTGAEKSAMDILYSGLQNGFIGSHFAQYWSGNTRTNDSQYLLDENNNTALWNTMYTVVIHNLNEIIRLAQTDPPQDSSAVNQIAISYILKTWAFQILTDTYGNVPYSDAVKGDANIQPKYDDARAIYTGLLDTLQQQLAVMDENRPGFGSGDVIFNGDVAAWKKLGHSLALRLAIRLADADPATAKSVIEANYTNAMTSNADNAQFQYLTTAPNKYPQNDSERDILDFFVSATMVDYLKATEDPRLEVYVRPAADGSGYVGMPYGTAASNPSRKSSDSYSWPGTRIYAADMVGILMTYPEVEFILAEAAARGMAVGDAATHYNAGVTSSLEYWGITNTDTVNSYLARVPYTAGDWRNVIGTQKWLALYPQGFQGWFERTRLDFKKPDGTDLFIAPVDGSLDQNVTFVPFRLTYPTAEQQQNTIHYQEAASAIGGDTKGTRLFFNKR
ncbi:SusD/RagB family nutrient-binding outer membrane lipoprotein [Chitinophaga tropicalis]|uniref:SusD/RagB family nutrient-binding outer membrane lipoprotein n=1 Tax=Chitinophaga tropicalis TaxID=2683588 RepID=A0A7K1TXE3_9BACT|nr:SusD/RagB family nutrient-binding outer membrane lipoprotein [Chitinophaga tropicalis]MVT06781.1 SusD/RagB family nutrient-binding outer membrane lipoprotein [Chitinophaga tropicalis]